MHVTDEEIDNFFKKINEFAGGNKLPSFMCFNLDEESHGDYVDSNEKIFFPPHSSNQPQPLDLGMFAVHKTFIKREAIDKGDTVSDVVHKITSQITGWEKTNTTKNNQRAWRAIGATFSTGDPNEQ